MWLAYCEVLGAVVVVVAVCHLWQTCCCCWCWRSCYGQVFQAVWDASASLKVLVLLLALQWEVVGVPQSLVRAVVGSHLCLLTVMSGDGGGLGCYVFPWQAVWAKSGSQVPLPRHNPSSPLFHSWRGSWCPRCLCLIHLLSKQCNLFLQKLVLQLQLGNIGSSWSLLWRTLLICSSMSENLCAWVHILQMFFRGQDLAILALLNFCLQPLQWYIFLSASMLGLCCLDMFFAEAFLFFAGASKSVACRPVAFESEACKFCVAFSLLVVPLVVGFSGVPMV